MHPCRLGARGFSKFIRGIWTKLGPVKNEKQTRRAFAVIIDEVGELVRQSRWQLDLESRFKARKNPDGTGGSLVPLRDCPRSS